MLLTTKLTENMMGYRRILNTYKKKYLNAEGKLMENISSMLTYKDYIMGLSDEDFIEKFNFLQKFNLNVNPSEVDPSLIGSYKELYGKVAEYDFDLTTEEFFNKYKTEFGVIDYLNAIASDGPFSTTLSYADLSEKNQHLVIEFYQEYLAGIKDMVDDREDLYEAEVSKLEEAPLIEKGELANQTEKEIEKNNSLLAVYKAEVEKYEAQLESYKQQLAYIELSLNSGDIKSENIINNFRDERINVLKKIDAVNNVINYYNISINIANDYGKSLDQVIELTKNELITAEEFNNITDQIKEKAKDVSDNQSKIEKLSEETTQIINNIDNDIELSLKQNKKIVKSKTKEKLEAIEKERAQAAMQEVKTAPVETKTEEQTVVLEEPTVVEEVQTVTPEELTSFIDVTPGVGEIVETNDMPIIVEEVRDATPEELATGVVNNTETVDAPVISEPAVEEPVQDAPAVEESIEPPIVDEPAQAAPAEETAEEIVEETNNETNNYNNINSLCASRAAELRQKYESAIMGPELSQTEMYSLLKEMIDGLNGTSPEYVVELNGQTQRIFVDVKSYMDVLCDGRHLNQDLDAILANNGYETARETINHFENERKDTKKDVKKPYKNKEDEINRLEKLTKSCYSGEGYEYIDGDATKKAIAFPDLRDSIDKCNKNIHRFTIYTDLSLEGVTDEEIIENTEVTEDELNALKEAHNFESTNRLKTLKHVVANKKYEGFRVDRVRKAELSGALALAVAGSVALGITAIPILGLAGTVVSGYLLGSNVIENVKADIQLRKLKKKLTLESRPLKELLHEQHEIKKEERKQKQDKEKAKEEEEKLIAEAAEEKNKILKADEEEAYALNSEIGAWNLDPEVNNFAGVLSSKGSEATDEEYQEVIDYVNSLKECISIDDEKTPEENEEIVKLVDFAIPLMIARGDNIANYGVDTELLEKLYNKAVYSKGMEGKSR